MKISEDEKKALYELGYQTGIYNVCDYLDSDMYNGHVAEDNLLELTSRCYDTLLQRVDLTDLYICYTVFARANLTDDTSVKKIKDYLVKRTKIKNL